MAGSSALLFVAIALDEKTPDHSTISRARRLIDLETHREVFGWAPAVLADRGQARQIAARRDLPCKFVRCPLSQSPVRTARIVLLPPSKPRSADR